MRIEKGHCPRCLFWHGWLPVLSGVNGDSPCAETAAQGSGHLLESALGSYSSRLLLSGVFLMDSMLMMLLFDYLVIPMFGLMLVLFWIRFLVPLPLVLGLMPIFLARLGVITSGCTLMMIFLLERMINSCRIYCCVPGPLQTVQRAELVLALQGF